MSRSVHGINLVAVWFLRAYKQLISPWLPPSCRFFPTCSEYAVEAFATRGFLNAAWLTARRIAKCGPWHPGGFDPVPDRTHDCQRGPCKAGTR